MGLLTALDRRTGSPLSLNAVGRTSLLMEPQGKNSGGIFVSSPAMSRIKDGQNSEVAELTVRPEGVR